MELYASMEPLGSMGPLAPGQQIQCERDPHVSVRITESNQTAWLNGTDMTKETNDVMIPQFTSKVVVAMVQNLMGFSTLIKPIG